MLAALLLLAAQDASASAPLPAPGPLDRIVALALAAGDPRLEGHGPSKRVEYTSAFSGTLHIWTSARSAGSSGPAGARAAGEELDLFLRLEEPDGKLVAEDDDAGGGKAPYLRLEVEAGRRLRVSVACAPATLAPGESRELELRLVAAPESEATRAAAEAAEQAIAEVKRLRGNKDLEAARALAIETIERLAAVAGAGESELVGRRLWELGGETYALSIPKPTGKAWSLALAHRLRTLPDEHADLQAVRGNLGVTLRALGDLQGARALDEKVLEVRSRTLPDEHPALQAARGNLAATIKALGNLEGARALQEKVLEVFTRTRPEEHRDVQAARGNLAATIKALGDLRGARALEEKVLEVRARTLPEEHRELQVARGNLALTIKALGDLQRARALEERALAVFSRTLPDEHPDLQAVRQNLSMTLHALGDLQGARALAEKVLELRSRTLPDEHIDLQAARSNLAATLHALGDHPGARALQEKVLEVLARTLPDEHPDLQVARQNLALTIRAQGDLQGARSLEEKVLEVRARTLPEEHPDLLMARLNLASTLYWLGELPRSRALLEDVLEVRSRTLPDDHADVQWARIDLAWTLLRQCALSSKGPDSAGGREVEADRIRVRGLIEALARAQTTAAITALQSAPGREAEERCVSLAAHLDVALSVVQGFGVFDQSPGLEPVVFDYGETTRNGGLAASALALRASLSPRYAGLRDRLRAASTELATLARRGTNSREFRDALVERESVERELLALAGEGAAGGTCSAALDADTLRARLEPGQAAVAYRRYVRWTFRVPSESGPAGVRAPVETPLESLCAFVVRGASAGNRDERRPPLALLDLGPIAPIEAAVDAWRAGLGVSGGRGLPVAPGAAAANPGARGADVRKLVFDPLRAALDDARHVILVLDDVLHLVPFDALPAEDAGTPLLGDVLRIETRATLGELLDATLPLAGANEFVGLGGADFDLAATVDRGKTTAGILRDSAFEHGFAPLPGTLIEVEGVQRLLASVAGSNVASTLMRGDDASKAGLLRAAPRARWLHLATHGWYASESIRSWSDPEPLDELSGLGRRMSGAEQVQGMSPMLLCGLALAGANLPDDAVGQPSGLITADELATLDLSNCALAVLSACDTNVGKRLAGQGVASLQEALQMAGARSVITSLWKVPDEATKELMLEFYRRLWVEKEPKWRALWQAKKVLREARDAAGDPKYALRDWAAWVLTGAPD